MIQRTHDEQCQCDTCLVGDTYQILREVLMNFGGDLERLTHEQLVFKLEQARIRLQAMRDVIEEAKEREEGA